MTPAPLVVFERVSKSYDGRSRVVDDLDLAIEDREFLTLLGPSGSGKTTTLMMLAGFEDPSEGDIRVNGQSVLGLPPYRRDIGVVFQSYALFPHMTVAENVAFPLSMRRVSRAEIRSRVAAALDMVRLGSLGDRRPAQLSGGQQQRVALARALVFAPELVLMDEPLGALDKQLREHMQSEIKALQRRLGITIVYVTHDQSEALTMSDRIAVFDGGRIRQIDTPEEIYRRPRTRFVAEFLGEMNVLPARPETGHATGAAELPVRLADGARALAFHDPADGAPGADMLLCIRPERIRLAPGSAPGTPGHPGEVREIVYHGDHLRVRVAAFGNEEITVRLPDNAPLDPRIGPGSAVRLDWMPGDARLLVAGPSAGEWPTGMAP